MHQLVALKFHDEQDNLDCRQCYGRKCRVESTFAAVVLDVELCPYTHGQIGGSYARGSEAGGRTPGSLAVASLRRRWGTNSRSR